MSTSTGRDVDVLIVGAGPGGTMLALELAAQKVDFRIVEKAPRRSDRSRALIIQPRSFEVMNRHGAARKLYERGSVTGGPLAWVGKKSTVDINVRSVANYRDSDFSQPCLLSQASTEAYLDECFEGCEQKIERGIEATSIIQDKGGVDVTLRNISNGNEEKIRAKYVVGADGAHSVVRKSSGNIKFEGGTYNQEFIMCDAIIKDFRLARDRYHLVLGTGLLAIFPMAEGWVRVMATRNRSCKGEPTLDEFHDTIRDRIPGGGEITEAMWITNFRLHHRIASSYRDARLILIGDAAHIHSPVGGQGLNTAVQDALNLGWKLASVVRGERPDSFLDTFNAERRPVGQELIAKTDTVFKLVSTTSKISVYFRNLIAPWVAPWLTSTDRLAHIYNFMSQFGINYRESTLTHTGVGWKGPVMAGDRAPDGDVDDGERATRLHKILSPISYNFVLFSDILRDGTGQEELARVADCFGKNNTDGAEIHIILQKREGARLYSHSLHSTYGFSSPGFVYIRPDGYVAAIGGLEHFDRFIRGCIKSYMVLVGRSGFIRALL
ncbi:FAD binding domain-containing protein [Nemania serpens]|nr:FAD binding domain-containing protein [Nemania serpens]